MLINIEVERMKNNLTKNDLAKKLNVSLRTYYNWINEETDIPSSKLILMATIFSVCTDYLLDYNKDKEKK